MRRKCFLTLSLFFVVSFVGVLLAAPSTARAEKIRITLGSCNKQYLSQSIWSTLTSEKSDLFLFLGDTIYADTDDMTRKKKIYDNFFSSPDFSNFFKSTRVEAIWDDHDFSHDDASGEAYPFRVAAQKVFLDAFQVPQDSARRKRAGIYDSWIQGASGREIQIILLDTRYFKSPLLTVRPTRDQMKRGITGKHPPQNDEKLTMLGEKQWAWLEQQLLKPAKVRIIASGSQIVPYERRGECWGNFPHERRRLFKLIAETRASGVLFVSGDTHFSEISKTDEGLYPFYDFTSSSLNQKNEQRVQSFNSFRVKEMAYALPNYGVIEIDWSKENPEISMTTKSSRGKTAFKLSVPLSELQFETQRRIEN